MSAFSRHVLSLCLLGAVLLLAFAGLADARAQADRPLVHVARIDGAITPVMARYIHRAVERAESAGANALIIEMDTPGGTSDAMDDIVDDIVASEVPVVVYVSPSNARAASAGVFITYAAHIAVMAPATNIGSASPVLTGSTGSVRSDETMERKVMNDAIARITALAELRGRNVDWAVSAVRDAANITASEALSLGVIDLIEPDLDSVLQAIDGRPVMLESGAVTLATAGARLTRTDMSVVEEFVQYLADPTIAYLLVTFGLIALFIELSNPGIGYAGVLGVLSLVFGLLGLGSLPVVWLGLGLMIAAFILFVIDIFVPSFGLLTIGGLACFLIGSNILIADGTPSELRISRPVIWALTACIAGTALLLGSVVVRSQLRPAAAGGKASMVGQVGTTRTSLDPSGQVMVFGEIWSAESLGEPIPAGTPVVVERVSGLRAYVRPAEHPSPGSGEEIGDRRTVIPVR